MFSIQFKRGLGPQVSASHESTGGAVRRAPAFKMLAGPALTPEVAGNQSAGSTLPEQLRTAMESQSALDLSAVRVHYDSDVPAQFGAHAFAKGTDIHLAPGQEKHLPHEAWHVVQQLQGRVRATNSLHGVGVNDDSAMEQEADRMGEAAMRQPVQDSAAKAPLRKVSANENLIQGKFILRNGKVEEVDDDYELKKGESDWHESLVSHPKVILSGGKQVVSYDEKGDTETVKIEEKIPTYRSLQQDKLRQGKELRKMIEKMEAEDQLKLLEELEQLADRLESHVPEKEVAKHIKKVRNVINKEKAVGGNEFRKLIDGKDELTQSNATSPFFQGFYGKDAPQDFVKELAEVMLYSMSALRLPTETVVAPTEHKGNKVGMRHPTTPKMPPLKDGSSSHNFSDRSRTSTSVDVFDFYMNQEKPDPKQVIGGMLLAPCISTLNFMSAPLFAKNLPEHDTGRNDEQMQDREYLKQQVHNLGGLMGLKEKDEKQEHDAPRISRKRAVSPTRFKTVKTVDDTDQEDDKRSEKKRRRDLSQDPKGKKHTRKTSGSSKKKKTKKKK